MSGECDRSPRQSRGQRKGPDTHTTVWNTALHRNGEDMDIAATVSHSLLFTCTMSFLRDGSIQLIADREVEEKG